MNNAVFGKLQKLRKPRDTTKFVTKKFVGYRNEKKLKYT